MPDRPDPNRTVPWTDADLARLNAATPATPVADYDDLPFDSQPGPPTIVQELTERKCRRHKWVRYDIGNGHDGFECSRCGVVKDEARSRRGKSSRRLGNDQERRAERVYGFRKVGEFGGITDLQGKATKVQQKSSRAPAPVKWKGIFARLDEVADGRMPAILYSFIRQGLPAEDYFIVRGKDWLDWRGRDE